MSSLFTAVSGSRLHNLEAAMKRPEVPFPKHWLYYIAIKLLVLGGALALALRLFEVW